MKNKYWLGLWLAAVLLLFFCNGSLLVTDSVEANYALTAKEMVLSGDWLSPQIYGRYWYDKPIMFYWLTALAFKLWGFTEFAARFFPVLFGLAGLGLVCWGGKRLYNERVGFYSGLALLTSVEFFLISKSIITDAVLFVFFSATLLFFYLGYRDGRARDWYAMYAAAALAVLTKGPIGVLLPGLIITLFLLWQRDWRVLTRCRLFSGTALLLLVAAPWYVFMYNRHGMEFINTFFGVHNFLRASVSEHPKDDVIYYYALVNLLAFFPWSGLLPQLVRSCRGGEGWDIKPREGFLMLWSAVIFIFFQCMATKYITYTYPLLFPASILIGKLLAEKGERCFSKGYCFFLEGFFLLLLGAAWWVQSEGLVPVTELFMLPLSLIFGLLLFIIFVFNGRRAMGVGAVCVLFYLALTVSVAVPLSATRSAKGLGELLQSRQIHTAGVYGAYPTSAVFYSGSRLLKLLHEQDVAGYVPKNNSWSSKNVMPYALIGDKSYQWVITRNKDAQELLQRDCAAPHLEGQAGQWLLWHG